MLREAVKTLSEDSKPRSQENNGLEYTDGLVQGFSIRCNPNVQRRILPGIRILRLERPFHGICRNPVKKMLGCPSPWDHETFKVHNIAFANTVTWILPSPIKRSVRVLATAADSATVLSGLTML